MQNQWDQRYASTEYVYGTEPNEFLKHTLSLLTPGLILFPAEGEGRNAVYAASKGWQTEAFDQSTEGQKKALSLAKQRKVNIHYTIQSLDSWDPPINKYDCISLIYVHLPETLRTLVHSNVIKALKPGGMLILEAFTPAQLTLGTGGPKVTELLYTKAQLLSDFGSLQLLELTETQTHLNEGPLHQGVAEVIRVVGIKM
jgi:2-polyprenyl-3-methyl-5-hydroxy-6-metoxy-1,4-benzoquinol methylase